MSKPYRGLLAGLVLSFAIAVTTPPPAPAAAANQTTVHLTFGLGATTEERWDGSILVRGGELVKLSEWHFLDRDPLAAAGAPSGAPPRVAEMIAPTARRVAATRDGVDGFHPINYLEMSPSEPLATLFMPVGLYATIDDPGTATVDVRTAQGDFSF